MVIIMKSIVLVACLLSLTACNESDSSSDANVSVEGVRELLAAGDPKVCSAENVQQLALIEEPEYADYLSKGGERLVFGAVNAVDVKKDIGEITCAATVQYRIADPQVSNRIGSESIRYTVRSTLNGSYVVEAVGGQEAAINQARFEGLMALYASRRAGSTTPQREPANSDPPSEDGQEVLFEEGQLQYEVTEATNDSSAM